MDIRVEHVSSTDAETNGSPSARSHRQENWNPPWLSKTVLFAFVALFLLLATSLFTLGYVVTRFNGLPLTLQSNHYVLAYGPTSILVIVVALWRRVQYCVMINQPWQELQSGPGDAERTLLLDYLLPLQLSSFWVALKNGHFAVTAGISIFALLKVVIVVSTMLFTPQDSVYTKTVSTIRQTKFGTDNAGFLDSKDTPLELLTATYQTSADPVWMYYNLRNQYRNDVPIQLSKAFTNFSVIPDDIPASSTTVSAPVAIFEPHIDCEAATMSSWKMEDGLILGVDLQSPSCPEGMSVETEWCLEAYQNYPKMESCQNFFIRRGDCRPKYPDYGLLDDGPILNTTTPNPFKYAIVFLNYTATLDGEIDNSLTNTEHTMYKPPKTTAITCSVGYSLSLANATSLALNPGHVQSLEATRPSRSQIDTLTDLQFSETVLSSLIAATRQNLFYEPDYSAFRDANDALLGLMQDATSAGSVGALYNVSNLQNAAEEVLSGLSHQVARHYFMLPDNDESVPGFVSYTERRLHTRPEALWAMAVLFIVMACLVLPVVIFTVRGVAPRSPATLASRALTLLRSPAMAKLLLDTGSMDPGQFSQTLAPYHYFTSKDEAGAPRIEIVANSDVDSAKFPEHKAATIVKRKRWMPFSAHYYAQILTLALPVAVIAILEILWHFTRNQRIFTPSSESSPAAYAIRYGSTVIALLVATFFNTLDFSIASITPYSHLATGRHSAQSTMIFSILEDLPPVALYKATRYGHFGAALSLIAATIGSVLTIVTSGLWVLDDNISISGVVMAKGKAGFALDFVRNTTQSTEEVVTAMNGIPHGVADNRPLVWNDEIVLPAVELFRVPEFLSQASGNFPQDYSFAVSALQPFLECTVVPEEDIQADISVANQTSELSPATVDFSMVINAKLPEHCSSDTNISTIQFGGISRETPLDEYSLYGYINDIQFMPASKIGGPLTSSDCPSLGVVYGFIHPVSNPNDRNDLILDKNVLTALLCNQRIRYVNVTAVFSSSLPNDSNSSIDTRSQSISPSQVLETVKTVQYPSPSLLPNPLVDKPTGSSLHYFIVAAVQLRMGWLDDGPYTSPNGIATWGIDQFIDHSFNLSGVRPGDASTISKPETLARILDVWYRQFMVRIFDADYRRTGNDNNDGDHDPDTSPEASLLHGTTTATISQLRLNKTSKVALQSMLGAMTLFGALAYMLVGRGGSDGTGMRDVLPRSPLPVASGLGLLAGSRLLVLLADDDPRIRERRLGRQQLQQQKQQQQQQENFEGQRRPQELDLLEEKEEEGEARVLDLKAALTGDRKRQQPKELLFRLGWWGGKDRDVPVNHHDNDNDNDNDNSQEGRDSGDVGGLDSSSSSLPKVANDNKNNEGGLLLRKRRNRFGIDFTHLV